jgi:hypothetical protein
VRKIVLLFAVLTVAAVAVAALWIFEGREISSFVDRYWTVEIQSAPIQSVKYVGSGSGGILIVNDRSLSLDDLRSGMSLSVGSTKDNQLALASNGRVFSFGPLKSPPTNGSEDLATAPPSSDQALVATRHGGLSWPTPFDLNFMTGHSPSWKRYIYQDIRWKKSSGANLLMLWRYEQFYYSRNGWSRGLMTREGSTGLIQVDISE